MNNLTKSRTFRAFGTTLTKEQYEQLLTIEEHLHTAVYSNYIRTMQRSEANLMFSIYEQLTGKRENILCGQCLMRVAKHLGTIFFNKKNEYVNNESKLPTIPKTKTSLHSGRRNKGTVKKKDRGEVL